MQQYHVSGAIRYLLFCPKAPGADLCDPPAACEGHDYPAHVDLYVTAPDEQRAEWAALKKLATAYPWPVFDGVPEVVLAELPNISGASKAPRGPYLPGFEAAARHAANLRPEALGDGVESVTLSSGDHSVTLRRPAAPGFRAD